MSVFSMRFPPESILIVIFAILISSFLNCGYNERKWMGNACSLAHLVMGEIKRAHLVKKQLGLQEKRSMREKGKWWNSWGHIALHADKYHTRVMAAIYIERDQMVLSAQHPSTQSLPAGSQYKTLDLSVYLASVPLDDKVNLHMQVGQMLYN